jgi:beta-lactamase class A
MKMLRRSLIALAATAVLAAASPDPGVEALERLFRAPQAQPDWFTPQFIEKVPLEKVNALLDGIRQDMGPLQSVSGDGRSFTVHLARGEVSARLALTDDGRIAGLLLRPAATQGSLASHVRAIASLPGETAILVTKDGATLAAVRDEAPLAVGSAFKLVVLKAVADAVEQRRLAWDQVVRLEPSWRSLPSGLLQDWPAGTPVTIATLADLMISMSDNTAADALATLIGRDPLEALSPRNAPFLTTREASVLKSDANATLRSRWLSADADGRREMLPEIASAPLPAADSLPATASLDIEWRLSARELAALLEGLEDAAALGINPGLASRADWRSVRFKGGSEIDCVNLSTAVTAHGGARHAVIVTWNGPGADVDRLATPYTGLLAGLAHGDG